VDRHVFARHGRVVVRQFTVEQRLRVSVLMDASASMGLDPALWTRAVEMAAIFGVVTLNGADQVRFGIAIDGGVSWGPSVSRQPQLEREIERLGSVRPRGAVASLADVARRSAEKLTFPGILVVISDWLVDGIAEALRAWRVRGQEIVAVQVVAAADGGASAPEGGWVQLIDVETGEGVERRLDASAWSAYRREVSRWSEEVQTAVWGAEGHWVQVGAGDPLDGSLVRSLRRRGLIT
jgi:uncharacterized protein (DUF58 family)